MIIVALAGGCGSRLWPYSNGDKPKQFLNFDGKKSFLKLALDTYKELVSSEKFFVVTSNQYQQQVKQSLDEVAPYFREQVLIEPYSRNTLPAVAWAIRHLLITKKAKASDNILIVPTDHVFSNPEAFRNAIKTSEVLADQGKLVAFGVKPKRAETEYGYIRLGESIGEGCYRVDSFIEKPEEALAKKFVENEDWLWNAGLYLFKIETFIEEIAKYEHSISHFLNVESHHEDYVFRSLASQSIDKGLIEKTSELVVCQLNGTGWMDIGSWENLYRYCDKDDQDNVKVGEIIDIDTKGCLIIGKNKVISTVGVEDLIIVDSEDTLLIAKKSDSRKIQDIIEKMKMLSKKETPI